MKNDKGDSTLTPEEKRKYYEKKQKKEMAQILLEFGCSKKDATILLSELYQFPEEKAARFVYAKPKEPAASKERFPGRPLLPLQGSKGNKSFLLQIKRTVKHITGGHL